MKEFKIEKGLLASSAQQQVTDNDLIDLAKTGDELAFRELVGRHKSKIAATIYGMLGKCDEADDIGQEVFIRFYNSMDNFRGDSLLSTYLIRIAINLSLNEIKKKKRRQIFSFDKLVENGYDAADPKDSFYDKENKELVGLAVQRLSPKYKAVLVLRLIDGYTCEETAKILEIPLGTVLSRLTRAQKKLKEHLQQLKYQP